MTTRLARLLRADGLRASTRAALFLLAIDSVTNLTDFIFHFSMGRALTPGAFAALQTVNAVVLVLVTAFAVIQPVVARWIADPRAESSDRAIFQTYIKLAAALGLVMALLGWLGRDWLGLTLNVPSFGVALTAAMVLFIAPRPVVTGTLQGQERFVAFGSTRVLFSMSRLSIAALLLALGWGLTGALAAYPAAAAFSFAAGLFMLGSSLWRPTRWLPTKAIRNGIGLSAYALVGFAAYMLLLSLDLIWVNRTFAGETAGVYAAATLFRRALLLAPGAVIVVAYPRIVKTTAGGRPPDRILLFSGIFLALVSLALTAVYFLAGRWLLQITFGVLYINAASLLGWFGLAMLGYAFTSLWLNLYLATRPVPYVALLAAAAVTMVGLLAYFAATLEDAMLIFMLIGWMLAGFGLLLYLTWLRPGFAGRPNGTESMLNE